VAKTHTLGGQDSSLYIQPARTTEGEAATINKKPAKFHKQKTSDNTVSITTKHHTKPCFHKFQSPHSSPNRTRRSWIRRVHTTITVNQNPILNNHQIGLLQTLNHKERLNHTQSDSTFVHKHKSIANTTRPVNTQTRPNRNTTVSNSSITVPEPKHKEKKQKYKFPFFLFLDLGILIKSLEILSPEKHRGEGVEEEERKKKKKTFAAAAPPSKNGRPPRRRRLRPPSFSSEKVSEGGERRERTDEREERREKEKEKWGKKWVSTLIYSSWPDPRFVGQTGPKPRPTRAPVLFLF